MHIKLGLVVIFVLFIVGVCFAAPGLWEELSAGLSAVFG